VSYVVIATLSRVSYSVLFTPSIKFGVERWSVTIFLCYVAILQFLFLFNSLEELPEDSVAGKEEEKRATVNQIYVPVHAVVSSPQRCK